MGIKGDCKKWLLREFASCVTYDPPPNVPVVSIDMMQYVKGSMPPHFVIVKDVVRYLIEKIMFHFEARTGCMIVIVNFDLGSPGVKQIVEHSKRHDVRCTKCKSTPKFHRECEKRCVEKQPLKYGDGPYLRGLDSKLPVPADEWMRFAMDSRNLRTELYPLLMNELLLTTPVMPGQMIIVNGLPARTRILAPHEMLDEVGYIPKDTQERSRVVRWLPEEMPVPLIESVFHTVFMIKWTPEGRMLITDCPEMKNDIHEADNSVYFFSQFFPGCDQIISINDGDAIPIGLLRCAEDFRGGEKPTHTTWLRLPYKITNKLVLRQKFGNSRPPKFEYINLSEMYKAINEYRLFAANGVQNPVASLVFLVIASGTDFFEKCCPGVGLMTNWHNDEDKQAKQTMGIWDTFIDGLSRYSHLVQWYSNDMQHDPTQKRRIVLDEELFRQFIYKCYFNKFFKDKPHTDVQKLRVHCSKKRWGFPSTAEIHVWCRNISWNMQYWVNACRNIYIEPFEKVDGRSYWGYLEDRVADNVHPAQKPVDRVYKRHFCQKKVKSRAVSATKKRKVVTEMKDQVNNLFI